MAIIKSLVGNKINILLLLSLIYINILENYININNKNILK